MVADKLILVHNGALGDFLVAWPAVLALARRYGGDAALLYAGREAYAPWARAAGFDPAPTPVRAAVERLYAAHDWTDPAFAPLAGSRVVWIGLDAPPFDSALLTRQYSAPRLDFLSLVGPPIVGAADADESTREHLGRMLGERLGVAWPEDAAMVWQKEIARREANAGGGVLLFPGTGHRAKEWPAENWRELARRLLGRGTSCRLALGPAELERGFDAQDIPVVSPASLGALVAAIAASPLVVSADTGPMHAAALAGTPALALFGPTSARLWAPAGVRVLRSGVDCRPCSRTTRDIACTSPGCMAAIDADTVERTVCAMLDAGKEKPA